LEEIIGTRTFVPQVTTAPVRQSASENDGQHALRISAHLDGKTDTNVPPDNIRGFDGAITVIPFVPKTELEL
jgi:hypothetical protein